MTSEVEERPRLVTGGYGRHRRQWVKNNISSNSDSDGDAVICAHDPLDGYFTPLA